MKIDINELVQNSFVLSIYDERLQFFYDQWKASGLPLMLKYVKVLGIL